MSLEKNKNSQEMIAWVLMFLSLLFSSMSRAVFRYLSLGTHAYSPEQFLAAQTVLGTILLGVFLKTQRQPLFSRVALSLQVLRALIAVIGYHFLLMSLKLYPLYMTTLIGLSAIFLTTLGSVVFFEHSWPSRRLALSCMFGLIGSMLSVQSVPHLLLTSTLLAPIMATFLFTASSLILKKILIESSEQQPLQQLFSLLFFMSLFLLPSFNSFVSFQQIAVMPESSLLALLYVLSQGCYIAAYQKAPLSSLSPIKFFKIPLAAFWDYSVFQQLPSAMDQAAAFFIVLGLLLSKPAGLWQNADKKKHHNFQAPRANYTKVLS